jgi:hypothetical protein
VAYLPELLTKSIQRDQGNGDWFACFASVADACPGIEAVDCSVHDFHICVGLAKPEEHLEFQFNQFQFEFALMSRLRMVKTFIFFAALIVHWVGQFVAWSSAERSSSMRVLWNILATPLVHVSSSITNQYFWAIVTANSVLWAAILTYIVARFAQRH